MTVYHISKDGMPRPCGAKDDNCPLGGEHFTSLIDARTFSELKAAQEAEASPVDRILEDTFSIQQRRRMFQRNPSLDLSLPIGTVVVSSSGDLWRITKLFPSDNPFETKLQLRNRRSGKFVTVGSADANEPAQKELSDFSLLTPKTFGVDGRPIHDSPRFVPIAASGTVDNVLLLKVRVATVNIKLSEIEPVYGTVGIGDNARFERITPPEAYRYLAVYPASRNSLVDKELRQELSLAIWKQAGRDEESWQALSPEEKSDLVRNSSETKKARFTVRGERIRYENEELRSNQFDSFLPPSYVSKETISGYNLKA